MHQLTIILLQLLLVALSGVIAQAFRAPLPLLQVGLGAALSFLIGSGGVPDPTLFLLLFIAPLLYIDAFNFPQAEFSRLKTPIIAAAVGLVAFTVAGTGYFIHWLIPSVPLTISFAIASVLSPTDAVAVAGSLGAVRLPGWLMHILEGEALLNDASGLVCLRFAISAALSGQFSFGNAVGTFLLVALGGILLGAALVFCIAPARQWMERTVGSQASTMILIHLLFPFAAYMAAEHFHVSGILAAVAAGFAMRWFNKDEPGIELRLRGEAIMDALQFTFNGFVFVLLGLQLPAIARNIPAVAQQQGFDSVWRIGVLVAEISFALMLLRFLWIGVSSLISPDPRKDRPTVRPRTLVRVRTVVALTFAGVRGAVTLAAVLSFPLTLSNGAPLPGRDLAIILSAGIILVWLLLASVALPWLVKGIHLEAENTTGTQERKARNLMIEAAIRSLEEVQAGLSPSGSADSNRAAINIEVAARLSEAYRRRLRSGDATLTADVKTSLLLTAEKELHLQALRAERKELRLLQRQGEIEHHSVNRLLRVLDTAEAALMTD